MRFFRSAPFSGAMLIAVAASGILGGFLFLNTLYLQNVRGDSALGAFDPGKFNRRTSSAEPIRSAICRACVRV